MFGKWDVHADGQRNKCYCSWMPLPCRPIIGLFHQENEYIIIKTSALSSLKISCVNCHNLFLKRWGVSSVWMEDGEGGSPGTTQGSI